MPELIIKILKRCADVPGPITQRLGISENDPCAIVPSIAPVQRPPIEQLLESHKSRFSDIAFCQVSQGDHSKSNKLAEKIRKTDLL